MKKLIIAFLLLLFAVWLGFLIHRDPGYILVTYRNWSIETSLWVGIIAVLIAFLILYIVLRLFRHTTRLGVNLQTWNRERRERKAGELTNQGFDALIEMQWRRAEDLFAKSAKNSTCPVINYSAAAYAAQQLFAYERRNKYLTKLTKQVKSASKTAKLVESYFYIKSNQWQEALTLLRILQKKYPQDGAVVRFLTKTLEALGNWDSIKELMPLIEKHANNTEYKKLVVQLYRQSLEKAIHPEWLDSAWQEVPKNERIEPLVASTYARKARELRRDDEAVGVIEVALKKNWDSRLIKEYGKLKSERVNKQISHAESWLKKHNKDADLLVCLGRLCIQAKLWGKARDYLNNALEIAATSEAYCELGQLCEAIDDHKGALNNYRKALQTEIS